VSTTDHAAGPSLQHDWNPGQAFPPRTPTQSRSTSPSAPRYSRPRPRKRPWPDLASASTGPSPPSWERAIVPAAGSSLDDAVSIEAARRFAERYGEAARRLPPIAIVIAAFNEEGVVGSVVAALPASIAGLGVAVIVVSDGAGDGTAAEARAHGALVCEVPVNRGQGAALRLGYRLACYGGASFIVTTDADGQYDAAEIERVLRPVMAGEADFSTGSRTIGAEESRDPVRRLGVRVFALLISVLTGQHISDTTFGLRAMRAEVTGAVRLEQPQYQAAELLIAVLARGYRVAEVPATIHKRAAGNSKKGNNAWYGLNFACVVIRTWWRERKARKPALRRTPGSLAVDRLAAHAAHSSGPLAFRTGPDRPATRHAPRHRKARDLPGVAGMVQSRLRGDTGRRFRRFIVAAIAAVTASQVTLSICLGLLGWTAGRSALTAWMTGAAVSYVISRWAWERKGKPNLLKETIPFWLIAAGTAAVLTLATKAANQYAISAGFSHLQQVIFVDGCFFLANLVTFLTRFLIFHYVLFAERTPWSRSVPRTRSHLARTASDPRIPEASGGNGTWTSRSTSMTLGNRGLRTRQANSFRGHSTTTAKPRIRRPPGASLSKRG
jgi:putative flippase GtrA